MKGDCFKQMKDLVQQRNFESGQKVFHISELKNLLKNYSPVQIQRTAKEHLKSKFGIFKPQVDSNGKEQRATYVLKSLYVLENDDQNK